MSDLLIEIQDDLFFTHPQSGHKHNAFDNVLLSQLQKEIDAAMLNPRIRVMVIKANGSHFSAGADLDWMQQHGSI